MECVHVRLLYIIFARELGFDGYPLYTDQFFGVEIQGD